MTISATRPLDEIKNGGVLLCIIRNVERPLALRRILFSQYCIAEQVHHKLFNSALHCSAFHCSAHIIYYNSYNFYLVLYIDCFEDQIRHKLLLHCFVW